MNPPDDAVRYRQSVGMVWFFRIFTVLALGLAALFGFALLSDGKTVDVVPGVLAVLFLGGGGLYCWSTARRAGDVFAVNNTGIWRLRAKTEPLFIAWNDATLRADDTMQRLIVTNRERTRTIWLEYQLENLPTLQDYARAHIEADPARESARPQVFHRSWINKIIISVVATCSLALAAVFTLDHRLPMALVGVVGFAFCVFGILRDPMSLTIKTDRVVMLFPGWKRDIHLGDINAVNSGDEFDRGNTWAVVTIALKQGRPIKLYRFREGSLALADALKVAVHKASLLDLAKQ